MLVQEREKDAARVEATLERIDHTKVRLKTERIPLRPYGLTEKDNDRNVQGLQFSKNPERGQLKNSPRIFVRGPSGIKQSGRSTYPAR